MPSKQAPPVHPGAHVREFVIPPGMTVKDAAKTLGVGRPALSNFLNGKAALSAEMAMRLEKSFGADRQKLLDLQTQHERLTSSAQTMTVTVKKYVPTLLTIKARQIEAWADSNLEARNQLPAFLRKLIHSTAADLRHVDFPAYDNAERKGWDGTVDAGTATPWVPAGQSGWEFGCTQDPQAKANKDYAARVASVPKSERASTTFVFVTPRNWPGKAAWVKDKNAQRDWNSVKAFDASDLEQWLEQSIHGQIWLAEKLSLPVKGYRTLDEAWRRWSSASTPNLSPEVFAPAIASYAETFKKWLEASPERPFIVAADSKEEGLAFLACLMKDEKIAASPSADFPVVFDSSEALSALAAASSPFMPIVHATDTERELAPIFRRMHCIVVRPRNAVDSDPEITLDLLRHEDFTKALEAMGIGSDEIRRLEKSSARSPTILRRLLSPIDAIRSPHWVEDSDVARQIVPIALVGAWHAGSKADCEIVSLLAGRPYNDIEARNTRLLPFDDCPLWAAGKYWGVSSKIDALFAVSKAVIRQDLEDFFFVAELVLSERDPKLDLPEGDRWAAGMYGKVRDHSAALRAGICETLVILAVHGNTLFQGRMGVDVEARVSLLIRKLLSPLTLEKLLSQNHDLPNYAEAAPEEFFRLIEEDLRKNEPVVFQLMKPVDNSVFGADCPRTGLLWALENLAWKPQNLPHVVPILAKLSTRKIDDNWTNKPTESLQSIFRSWMPQTAAPLEQRILALELLVKRFPAIGWAVCAEQFETGSQIGHYSHRPSWRGDASGAGQPLDGPRQVERYHFVRKAIELAIGWSLHDEKTLGDLIERLEVLSDEHQTAVWDAIDAWTDKESNEDAKAALRERIRRFAFTRQGRRRELKSNTKGRARDAFIKLTAKDPVIRHRWLFADTWVEESLDEIEDVATDFREREKRIQNERLDALKEIWTARGFEGVAVLLANSSAPHIIGFLMVQIAKGPKTSAQFVASCLGTATGDLKPKFDECLRGYLLAEDEPSISRIVAATAKTAKTDILFALYLCMPFKNQTWSLLGETSENFRQDYWANVRPQWGDFSTDEANELIDRLLDARRPVAAFHAVHMDWKKIETSRLKRLLIAVATTGDEKPKPYKFSQYELSAALKELDGRAGVSVDDMAHLEFMYLKALDHSEHGIPNLEKQIAMSPPLYVQAVAFSFRRNDDKEDPPEWKIDDRERQSEIASATYSLLHRLRRIPGTGDDGKINIQYLTNWLAEVRSSCERHGRGKIADQMIGELLSRAPAGDDGMWPCRAVCEALEAMASPDVATGFEIGTRNSRGVVWRGEGGGQERELAARYRVFAQKLAFEFPHVGSIIERIASSYDHEAKWEDSDAKVRSRLPY